MRFGKSAEEAATDTRGGDGGELSFMKYMKDGDNILRVADEPDKWVYYWEHFNPDGNPFPCTNERDTCPGCTSDNEKMSKASRKVAFNAVSEYDGKAYVNVWKVPKTVSDKLKTRYERLGTVTDRYYIVTRFKKDNGFYDYDVEGQDKTSDPIDTDRLRDPEELLVAAYDEAWGNSAKAATTSAKASQAKAEASLEDQLAAEARRTRIKREEPKDPEPEREVTEAELRAMEPWDLVKLCKDEGYGEVPQEHAKTSDSIVDWMLSQ
jgi:hypothetical protein